MGGDPARQHRPRPPTDRPSAPEPEAGNAPWCASPTPGGASSSLHGACPPPARAPSCGPSSNIPSPTTPAAPVAGGGARGAPGRVPGGGSDHQPEPCVPVSRPTRARPSDRRRKPVAGDRPPVAGRRPNAPRPAHGARRWVGARGTAARPHGHPCPTPLQTPSPTKDTFRAKSHVTPVVDTQKLRRHTRHRVPCAGNSGRAVAHSAAQSRPQWPGSGHTVPSSGTRAGQSGTRCRPVSATVAEQWHTVPPPVSATAPHASGNV
ncbi:uncharacterized protein LOC127263285 [Andrographis paniculata]|uniref:uncharacterized protein LOC127263285 n=1 Tax=Andrographis paniculata TaxID=175694 RepID=UPI0021E7636C|nr:uncharacterized protein LOC127263285 [Andrographis paniculata]